MDMALLLGALRDDVAVADALAGEFSIWNLRTRQPIFGPEVHEPDLSEFATEGFAIHLGGAVTDIGSAAPEELAVAAAGVVQEWIIDRHNQGWPEIYRESAFIGLLEPRLFQGVPCWLLRDEGCAFGDLQQTYGDIIRSFES